MRDKGLDSHGIRELRVFSYGIRDGPFFKFFAGYERKLYQNFARKNLHGIRDKPEISYGILDPRPPIGGPLKHKFISYLLLKEN